MNGSNNEVPRTSLIPTPTPRNEIASDVFYEFNYSQPPLAEIQILRALEGHMTRKKKDQLEKARRFKEQLMNKK